MPVAIIEPRAQCPVQLNAVPVAANCRLRLSRRHRRLRSFRQLGSAVGLFPSELGTAAAEVAACRRGAVDRPAQLKVVDDATGCQREELSDQVADAIVVNLAATLCIDVYADRFGNTNRVGQLHFTAVGQGQQQQCF